MPLDLDYVGTVSDPVSYEYNEDDAILYALGIGAEPEELDFVYEKNLKVFPTFATLCGWKARFETPELIDIPHPKRIHGENRIEVYKPLPRRAKVTCRRKVLGIHDKGKGALHISEVEAVDESGEPLFKNIGTTFLLGEGGFGGERGPSGAKNVPPDRAADASVSLAVRKDQALLYRMNGDKNPLHCDPEAAKMAGFERPILHGLCTYGMACRSILKAFCGNEPSRLKALEVRFAAPVYPGDTLTTEMWDAGGGVIVFQTKTEAGVVLSNASAEIE